MSASLVTVSDLIRQLQQYPPDMLTAVINPGPSNWSGECFVDGPSVVKMPMWEIRSGWDLCEYQGASDDDYASDILILSDLSDESNIREWREDEYFESGQHNNELCSMVSPRFRILCLHSPNGNALEAYRHLRRRWLESKWLAQHPFPLTCMPNDHGSLLFEWGHGWEPGDVETSALLKGELA